MFYPQQIKWTIEVLHHNPLVLGLLDHNFPVLIHNQTDHNTEPVEH